MGCLAKEIRALETAEKMMARLTVPSGRDEVIDVSRVLKGWLPWWVGLSWFWMLLVGNWNHIEWIAGSRESCVTGLSV